MASDGFGGGVSDLRVPDSSASWSDFEKKPTWGRTRTGDRPGLLGIEVEQPGQLDIIIIIVIIIIIISILMTMIMLLSASHDSGL